jgi:hypothetical protein
VIHKEFLEKFGQLEIRRHSLFAIPRQFESQFKFAEELLDQLREYIEFDNFNGIKVDQVKLIETSLNLIDATFVSIEQNSLIQTDLNITDYEGLKKILDEFRKKIEDVRIDVNRALPYSIAQTSESFLFMFAVLDRIATGMGGSQLYFELSKKKRANSITITLFLTAIEQSLVEWCREIERV